MANVWGSPVAKTVGSALPDCSKCRLPGFEDARASWGCDADALDAIFATTCSRCDGRGCVAPARCETCGDPVCEDGRRHWHRCPSSVVESLATPRAAAFMDAYIAFDAHGILPAPGGWLAQTACFADGVRCASNERGRWDKIEADHYERMSKRGSS